MASVTSLFKKKKKCGIQGYCQLQGSHLLPELLLLACGVSRWHLGNFIYPVWGFMLEKSFYRVWGFSDLQRKIITCYYGFKYKYLHSLGNLAFMEN